MFAHNTDCRFDTELSLISATITHADPYSKLVNPKRWLENRDLHQRAFEAVHGGTDVPKYITYQLNRAGLVDYHLLYSLVRGPIVAFLSALNHEDGNSIMQIAAEVSEKSSHLFCRQQFAARASTLDIAYDDAFELSIIIPFRAATSSDGRLFNLVQTLQKLAVAMSRFPNLTVVVVESDSISRYGELITSAGALYRHHQHSGPFNKAAAINFGYRSLPVKPQYLCLLDSDAYLDEAFVDISLTEMRRRHAPALMPFLDMLFLDFACSMSLRSSSVDGAGALNGYLTRNSPGGCIWVTSELFEHVGGFDDRFEGWGGEDRNFYDKIQALSPIVRLPGVFLHLFHERAPEIHAWAQRGGSWQNNYSQPRDSGDLIINSAPR